MTLVHGLELSRINSLNDTEFKTVHEGWLARFDFKTEADNPYRDGTDLAKLWAYGLRWCYHAITHEDALEAASV